MSVTNTHFFSNNLFQHANSFGDTLYNLSMERGDFWKEIRWQLDYNAAWKKIKIGNDEISREQITLLALLNLPLTPSHIPAIIRACPYDSLQKLVGFKVEPIVYAVYFGDYELVRLLLDQGAPADLKIPKEREKAGDFKGYSLVDIAVFLDHLAIFHLLIEKGAFDPNGPPLSFNIDFLRTKPAYLKSLIQHKWIEAFVLQDGSGFSPLHWAVKARNLAEVTFWLDLGVPVDTLSSYRRTPLQIAVSKQYLEIVNLLIKRGANPTYALTDTSDVSLLKLLLEKGANPEGASGLLYSFLRCGDLKTFELIVSCYKNNFTNLIALLKQLLTWDKESLSYAKELQPTIRSQGVRILAEKLKDQNIEMDGMPLLHHIAIYNEKLAISLIKGGANPHLITTTGISVLHLAVLLNLNSLTATLIHHKVNLAVVDYTGATPLNHALNYHKTHAIARMLIEASGEMIHVQLFYLYNSYKLLGIKWLSPLMKKEPLLHAQWKEMNLEKLCAHVFDLEGQQEVEGLSYHREGWLFPRWMIKKIGQCPNNRADLDPNLFQAISSLCAFTANPTATSQEYLERIQAHEPVAIISATHNHWYYFLFYQNIYAFCNGHFDSLFISTYEQENLTVEIIERLRFECSIVDKRETATKLRADVERILSVKQIKTPYKSTTWAKQKIGNCGWKGFEMLIHIFVKLKNGKEGFIEEWLSNLKTELSALYASHCKKGFSANPALMDVISKIKLPEIDTEKYLFSQFIDVPASEKLNYSSILPR